MKKFTGQINKRAKEIRREAAAKFGGVETDYNWQEAVSLACKGFVFETEVNIRIELEGEKIGQNRPWVAKITGLDPKWGVKREFLNGLTDYSKKNRPGTRGIETGWILDEAGIYEYSLPRSWNKTDRSFLVVHADGSQVETSDKFEIIEMLKAA